MRFFGREKELAKIQEKWRLASNINDPNPQLVILRGVMGVGKTRLAIEFFRALQESFQKDIGNFYWPKIPENQSAKIAVNPPISDCKFDQRIPFLWWGIKVNDPGTYRETYFDCIAQYDSFIHPQLVALSVKAQTFKTGTALANVWANVAKGSVAGALGIEAVLSIGTGVLKSIDILNDRYEKKTQNALQENKLRSESRVNALLDDLEKIMNPASRSFAKTPAVFFIDDAQFSWADQSLTHFIKHLMQKAMTQRWPALIIATHWRDDFISQGHSESEVFLKLISQMRSSEDDCRPNDNEARYGDLEKESFLQIDLKGISNLAAPLLEKFPGLLPHQAKELQERAAGNPRHMEQIISYLSVKESFFEDFDPKCALTEEGLKQALAKTQNIFDLVFERLCEESVEVQEAVCLASIQGLQFLSDVVQEMAKKHLQSDGSRGLDRAVDPLNMISIPRTKNVSEFADQLYYKVAQARREELKPLSDERALSRSLKDILFDRVRDLALEDSFENTERSLLMVRMAANLFDTDDMAVLLNSFALLCVLEHKQLNDRNAKKATERFREVFSNCGQIDVSTLNLPAIFQMCLLQGWDSSEDIMEQILHLAEAQTLEDASLEERCRYAYLLEASVSLRGGVVFEEEETKFDKRIQRAVEMRREIFSIDPSFENELNFFKAMVTGAAYRMNEYSDLPFSEQEVVSRLREFSRRTECQESRGLLLSVLRNFGYVQWMLSSGRDRQFLTEALDMCRSAFEQDKSTHARQELAWVLKNIGNLFASHGEDAEGFLGAEEHWREALVYLEEAVCHFRELMQIHGSRQYHGGFISVLSDIANAYRALDDRTKEISYLKELLGFFEEQIDASENFHYGYKKYKALHSLGLACKRSGLVEPAETYLHKARDLFPLLLELDTFDEGTQSVDLPRDQFWVLADIAELAIDRGDIVEATYLMAYLDENYGEDITDIYSPSFGSRFDELNDRIDAANGRDDVSE